MKKYLPAILAAVVLVLGAAALEPSSVPAEVSELSLPPQADCGCGDNCQCCDACPCGCSGKPSESFDKSPHIGKKVIRKDGRRWTVTDAWMDGDTLMYRYQFPENLGIASGYYDGTSGWTYPGDIGDHLQSSHGYSKGDLAGKSKDELESLHDATHNGTRVRSAPVQSSCPGGNCPAPRSRGLFGRWR